MVTATKTQIVPDFNEASHTYLLDGRPLPSVTQIIDAVIPRTFHPAAWYLGRGSAVHKAIQLSAAGSLDMESWRRSLEAALEPQAVAVIVNKTEAAAKFLRETGYRVIDTEVRLASRTYQFAGTIDLIAESRDCGILADWKSSIDRRVELQLGGYAALAKVKPNTCACAVELRDDGSYRSHFYDARQLKLFAQEFLSIRSAYGSMQQRNFLPKKGDDDGNR